MTPLPTPDPVVYLNGRERRFLQALADGAESPRAAAKLAGPRRGSLRKDDHVPLVDGVCAAFGVDSWHHALACAIRKELIY